jgi:hypothetical protein
MATPWERAKQQRYEKQERRTGKMPGARPQVNSGRIWSSLRDARIDSFIGRLLIDNKSTENKSYSITRDDWLALKRDANRTPPGCLPALQIDIQDVHLMVFELSTWDELVEYVLTLENHGKPASA